MVRRLVARLMCYGRFNPYGPYNRFARVIWHKPIYRSGPRLAAGAYDRESHNFSGAVVHQRLRRFANAVGAGMLLASLGSGLMADETGGNSLRQLTAEPAAWQGPALTAQLVPPQTRDPIAPNAPARIAIPSPATTPAPAQIVTPSSTPKQAESPLLDGKLPAEELLPPVVMEGSCEEGSQKGVQPYGGGHPTDWSWGCGGNPYR